MYPGMCSVCDGRIQPGQLIAEDTDGGYSHLPCLELDDEPRADGSWRQPPCPGCHLVHAPAQKECF